jgi:hypothetical protein
VCAFMRAVKELSMVREEDVANGINTPQKCFPRHYRKWLMCVLFCLKFVKLRKGVSHNIPFNKVHCVEFDIRCAIYFSNL